MKRPVAVTLAILVHSILAAWVLYVLALYWQKVTWRGVVLFSLLALVQIIGVLGWIKRYHWAPRLSVVLFGLYALMNFGNLGKAAQATNLSSVLWPLVLMGTMVWPITRITHPDVKKYLKNTQHEITTAQASAAEQIAAADQSSRPR